MQFTDWSPTHLIIAALAIATIVGQTIAILARLKQTTERLEKQGDDFKQALKEQGEIFFHAFERLEDRMDKRLSDMQAEMNQRLSDMQTEMNQRFTEMNQRLSDIEASIRQLNQNHIDHLTHHGRTPRANDS